MHRIAVLSDVDGNLESLEAVFADIANQDISQLVFLGDSIGFGPDPVECLQRMREAADIYLLGRLEAAITSGEVVLADYGRPLKDVYDKVRSTEHFEWLKQLPAEAEWNGIKAVHGDPRGQAYECIMAENITCGVCSMPAILRCFMGILLIGDNHQPWIYSENTGVHTDKELNGNVRVRVGEKTIISVGSVGQPRDGDPRACYAIVTAHDVTWRRLEYDISLTIAKVNAIPNSMPNTAERLMRGI